MIHRPATHGVAAALSGGRRPHAAALGVLVVLLAGLAGAPAVRAATPHISVVPMQPAPGQRVTVRGSGFCPAPCSTVTISVDGSVAASSVVVAADGTFAQAVGLTPVAGTSKIVASQQAGGGTREATAIVHIVAADAPPASPAPTPPPRPTATLTQPTASPTIAPPASTPPSSAPSAPAGSPTAAPPGGGATPQLSVVPAQPTPGQPVVVRGTGFCPAPCSPVALDIEGAQVAAGINPAADGSFSATVGLTPVSGMVTITASQTDANGSPRVATTSVTVVAADAAAGSPPAGSSAPTAPATAAPTAPVATTASAWLPAGLVLILLVTLIAGALFLRSRAARG